MVWKFGQAVKRPRIREKTTIPVEELMKARTHIYTLVHYAVPRQADFVLRGEPGERGKWDEVSGLAPELAKGEVCYREKRNAVQRSAFRLENKTTAKHPAGAERKARW